MPLLFATQEWVDALASSARSDNDVASAARSWIHGPIVLVVEPHDKSGYNQTTNIWIDAHAGEIRDVTTVDVNTARKAPFAIAGHYAHWKSVATGESVADAVIGGKLRFHGDLPALVRGQSLLAALFESAARSGTSFHDEVAQEAAAPAR